MKIIEINGESKCYTAWAKQIGITREAFCLRVKSGLKGKDLLSPKYGRIKNWSREKPAEPGKSYWYKETPDDEPIVGYTNMDLYFFRTGGFKYYINRMDGWWAKAEPPPFDGEVGE